MELRKHNGMKIEFIAFCSLLPLNVVQLSVAFSKIYTACLCLYWSLSRVQKTTIISSAILQKILALPAKILPEDGKLQANALTLGTKARL